MINNRKISLINWKLADTLAVINKLNSLNFDIFFEVENITWGIKNGLENGTSKLYNRNCYGYYNSPNGDIIIKDSEAIIVKNIFNLYLNGYSIIAIVREYIKSPTGKNE